MKKTLSEKLEQLEQEANIAPGKLESALICAFCLAATPVLLVIGIIIH
jgi:hypothetical protein